MGPIHLLVIGFDEFRPTGGIAAELERLSDAGTIRIIDARLVTRRSADSVLAIQVSDLTEEEMQSLRAAAGALIGLGAGATLGSEGAAALGAQLGAAAAEAADIGFGAAAIDQIADELEIGQAVILLVIEQVWASDLRDALVDSGGRLLHSGYVNAEGLMSLGALLGAQIQQES
jgi:uncharacterized membrane protein